MTSVVDRWQQNGLHFAAKATQHESSPVLVWCGFAEMKADSPVFEDPTAEVWFKYAETREEAIAHLLKEVYPGGFECKNQTRQ